MEQFLSDAAAGTLPKFAILDPTFEGSGANDDHPSHDIRLGQAFLATVFGALAKGPQWGKLLFVLTYDEHGGFYDHVSPPTTADANGGFTQLGFRVPSLVAGPFVRRGVVSTTFEHVSVIRTAARKWGLPLLNERVGVTNDLSLCIQPAYFTNPQAPPTVPTMTVEWGPLADAPPPPIVHAELAGSGLPRRDSLTVARAWLEEGRRLGVVNLVD
jgi:phospholipase C